MWREQRFIKIHCRSGMFGIVMFCGRAAYLAGMESRAIPNDSRGKMGRVWYLASNLIRCPRESEHVGNKKWERVPHGQVCMFPSTLGKRPRWNLMAWTRLEDKFPLQPSGFQVPCKAYMPGMCVEPSSTLSGLTRYEIEFVLDPPEPLRTFNCTVVSIWILRHTERVGFVGPFGSW